MLLIVYIGCSAMAAPQHGCMGGGRCLEQIVERIALCKKTHMSVLR